MKHNRMEKREFMNSKNGIKENRKRIFFLNILYQFINPTSYHMRIDF